MCTHIVEMIECQKPFCYCIHVVDLNTHLIPEKIESNLCGAGANVLDWGIVVSSNSSDTITFTFRLIPLAKV